MKHCYRRESGNKNGVLATQQMQFYILLFTIILARVSACISLVSIYIQRLLKVNEIQIRGRLWLNYSCLLNCSFKKIGQEWSSRYLRKNFLVSRKDVTQMRNYCPDNKKWRTISHLDGIQERGECIGTSYSVSFKCLIKATIKSQNAPVNVNVIFSDRDNI